LRQGDPTDDFRIADTSDGSMVGFGHVWAVPPHEIRGFVRVRPSARGRGVGTALLSWLEPRARKLAREASLDNDAVLTVTNWAQDGKAAALLARAGFSPLRHFLKMRIDLDRDLPEPVWPDGLEPRRFSSGADDAELFESFREAFADHWGNVEVDEAGWWGENRDAPNSGFDPSLWVVVPEGRTVTSFAICREREADGESSGWISLVGVRPQWRGRGLGEALLLYSLHEFKRRRCRHAALNIDVDNATGALRLYTKIGMEPTPAFTIWSKALDAGVP
jgi:mycothiol synthase